MTIYIAPSYLIIGVLILIFVSFFCIRKLLISDYFYNLTGRKIFYIRDDDSEELIKEINNVTGRSNILLGLTLKHGSSRDLIDSVYLPFMSIYICLTILSIAGMISYFVDNYSILYFGFCVCGLIVYFTFLIYLRMKIFYYGGSKAECEKKYFGTYPRVSYTWTMLLSAQSIVFYLLYIGSHVQIFIYCIIVALIIAHLYIFPDYMNRILPYDLRTVKGHYQESPLIITPILTILYLLGVSTVIM